MKFSSQRGEKTNGKVGGDRLLRREFLVAEKEDKGSSKNNPHGARHSPTRSMGLEGGDSPVGSGVDAMAAIPDATLERSPLPCTLAFDVRLMPSKKNERKMEPESQWAPSVVSVTSSSSAVEHRALGAVFFSPSFPPILPWFKCLLSLSLSLRLPPKASHKLQRCSDYFPLSPTPSLSSDNNTKATNAKSVCAVAWYIFFFPQHFSGRRWRVPFQHGFQFKIR